MARKYYALKQIDISLNGSKKPIIVLKYITNGNKNKIENASIFIDKNEIKNEKTVLFTNMIYTQLKERRTIMYEHTLNDLLFFINQDKTYKRVKSTKLYKEKISVKVLPFIDFVEYDEQFKQSYFDNLNKNILKGESK